ncbi:hypothetical protein ACIF6L_31875 [Kitasatospora sp. NPDC086009]|uniref:hypothetical protein n=1 Tax=unclassified Kitasatospora TaxID=2633591 RepID=UPI0037CA9C53
MENVSIRVENELDQPVKLTLEPIGSDHWMAPGEALIVVSEVQGSEAFVLEVNSEGISIGVNNGLGRVTDEDGNELESGYRRPHDFQTEAEVAATSSPRRRWPWRIFS